MSIRRAIEKIAYEDYDRPFDQQVWPVLVALGVSCALAIGAVVTLLEGAWMWVVLLALPALAAVAHFALMHMDDSKLKRSLQLAVLTSLSVHLLILILTSAVSIFHGPPPLPKQKVVQRRTRTIEITKRTNPMPWQKIVSSPIPEPDIKLVRKDEAQTNRQPQTLPTKETSPTPQPQIVKQERRRKSVPRFSKSISELKRSVVKNLPKVNPQLRSSESLPAQVGAAVPPELRNETPPTEQSATPPNRAETMLAQSPLSMLERRPTPAVDKQEATTTDTKAPSNPTQSHTSARSKDSPKKRQDHRSKLPSAVAKQIDLLASARPSTAAKKRRRDIIPLPSSPRQLPTANTKNQPNANQSEPSASATKLTRRPQKSDIDSTAPMQSQQTQRSRVSELARSIKRKTDVLIPSITSTEATAERPRRATSPSLIEVTAVPKESPSRRPSSKTKSKELNPQPAAMTRSTRGTSGIGKSNNVSNATGGLATPAARAADSAKRQTELNLPNLDQLMATSQKSKRARTVSQSTKPTSVFKADTASAAKLSGVKNPNRESIESAAAQISSALAKADDKIAAAKGQASADLGLTKVVMDHISQRRSGGGLPEIGPVKPDLTKRSSENADAVPALMAEVTFETASPESKTSQPVATRDLLPKETTLEATRKGGDSTQTLDFVSAMIAGAVSDSGEDPFARAFSNRRSTQPLTGDPIARLLEELLEDEKEKLAAGNRKTLVAQALKLNSTAEPFFSEAKTPNPDGGETETGPADAVSDALLGKLARRTVSPDASAKTSTATGGATEATEDVGGSDAPTGPTAEASPTVEAALANLESVDFDRAEQFADFQLDVDADLGQIGLGTQADVRAGADKRPATPTSLQIEPSIEQRFQRRDFGGTLAVSPDVVLAKEAFRQRIPSAVRQSPEPSTEAAIHLGLEFLAKHQKPDGSWALGGFDSDHPLSKRQLNSDTAATGLVLLAFQGGGYNHREFKYAAPMNHAIQWLIQHQADDGGLYLESDKRSDQACRMYSHGIATLALTEAYGMTQDPALKGPAQKAVDYIGNTQHQQTGGWRYFGTPAQRSTDTSVSGWMMMAIQSAELAELNVDPIIKQKLTGWLDVAADPKNVSTYRYNPYAVDVRGVSRIQGLRSTPSMTSVGLLMRIYSGWEKTDPRLKDGADYLLLQQLPNMTTRKMRDTYYWYYATQVLKHVGGDRWNQWNNTLRPLLIDTQQRKGDMAGSWHPYEPVPDRWGAYGGRLYVTTMNLLSLEVRHRLLPLYRKTNQ